jgi:hypothetical protein
MDEVRGTGAHSVPRSGEKLSALRAGIRSLDEVIRFVWTEASAFVRLRPIIALLLIMAASAMTALGPVALKLVVDGFTGRAVSAVTLIGLYVLSQWVARTAGEIRGADLCAGRAPDVANLKRAAVCACHACCRCAFTSSVRRERSARRSTTG